MVTGLRQLENTLVRKMLPAIEAAARDALEKAAEDLVQQMKRNAPVYAGPEIRRSDGSPIVPGALRDSIGWTWGKAPKGSVAVGEVGNVKSDLRITIYAGNKEAFYARWVEFGTQQWAGSPFFFRAYRDNKSKIKGRVTRAMRKAIKSVV